jgi:hypothetical protein
VVEGPTLEATKQALAQSFVGRAEFVNRYPANQGPAEFVEALLSTVLQTSGVDLSSQRASLLARYQAGTDLSESRSLVIRELVESVAFRQAEYNAAFVLTEYFSYLRRDPDQGGYDFWLQVLNNREQGNFQGMVCGFITSAEYQLRFSSIVSHTNRECGSGP